MENKKRHATEVNVPNNQEDYTKYLKRLSSDTQNYKILKYMIEHGSITSYECFVRFKCTRCSARIRDLKDLGVPICSETVTNNGVHYSRYFLGGTNED